MPSPRPSPPGSKGTGESRTDSTSVRDVIFDEDRHQLRTANGPEIMAALRNLATRPHPTHPRRQHLHRQHHQIPVKTPQTSHQTTHPNPHLNRLCRPPCRTPARGLSCEQVFLVENNSDARLRVHLAPTHPTPALSAHPHHPTAQAASTTTPGEKTSMP